MPVFDCNFFPHLWDEVLSNLSYSDKLKLRLVSCALRDTVDKSLGGYEIRLWSWDRFYSVTGNQPCDYNVMPFFSPSSSECNEAQVLALHRARDVKICEPNLPRVSRLLQKHLPPNASVTLNHGVSLPPANNGGTFNTTFEIPACRSLCVCIKIPCGCKKQSPVRTWSHSASSVEVQFTFWSDVDLASWTPATCYVAQHILTPKVKDLAVFVGGSEEEVRTTIDRWLQIPVKGKLELGAIVVKVTVRTSTGNVENLNKFIQDVFLKRGFSKSRLSIEIHTW